MELARPRVADADAGAVVQLRADPGGARSTRTTTASATPRRWPTSGRELVAAGRSPRNRCDPDDLSPWWPGRSRPATPDPVSTEAMPDKTAERSEGFLHLNETPEEIDFELRAQEGALWTGGPAGHRHLGLRLRLAGLRLLLPAVGQQREPVAPARDHGADRDRRGHLRRHGGRRPARRLRACGVSGRGRRSTGRWPAGRPCSAAWWPSGSRSGSSPSCPSSRARAATPRASSAGRVMNIALILTGLYWLETLLARQAPPAPGRCREDGGTAQLAPCRRPACSGPTSRAAPTSGASSPWSATFFWVLFYVI